ncbi:hypothetical protein ADMFC3_19930 [Geovibrio sp. ADMFC3]|jgi:TM2 domain-containing membrane protein YozV
MTPKEQGIKYCTECGEPIRRNAEICPKCGVRQYPNRNRLAAALLAFFLGGFGIHKFYLGKAGWGIVYLLLCWTFIPGLIGIVESIFLFLMSDQEFDVKYNSDR